MSCPHPQSARHFDRARGIVTCTLCGDVVTEQQFELDPQFARGERSGGGRAGGLRALGAPRPGRVNIQNMSLAPRPAVETARRGMQSIARQLEISHDLMEKAVGIYKLAVNNNAITGARNAVLSACLYAACRMDGTSHMVYDFADVTKESPYDILDYMKKICEATYTVVPPIDPSYMVERFAQQLNVSEELLRPVIICALKVLRAMHDDWISYGRRPMGVCAAALLVACHMFNVPRSPEDVCGMVRLSADTILRRVDEFSSTPAAKLGSIDSYSRSGETLPPAFATSHLRDATRKLDEEAREVAATYYELVAEAKRSDPATPERCEKWKAFLESYYKIDKLQPPPDQLDLMELTPKQQLVILGLPHTEPMTPDMIAGRVKEEAYKISMKREENSSSQMQMSGGMGMQDPHGSQMGYPSSFFTPVGHENPADVFGGNGGNTLPDSTALQQQTQLGDWWDNSNAPGFDDGTQGSEPQPNQTKMEYATNLFRSYLTDNKEVAGIREDFDLALKGEPGNHGAPVASIPEFDEEEIRDALYDEERPTAMPWEFIVLQDMEHDDSRAVDEYIIFDNEERIRRNKIGEAMYKEEWDRGRPRTRDEIEQLEFNRSAKRRRRDPIVEHASVQDALGYSLRGRGAGTINVSQIDQIIPGLATTDGDAVDAAVSSGDDDDWEMD